MCRPRRTGISPIGNRWWPRGGRRSRFDQQPIEATALLLLAANPPGDRLGRYLAAMERSYAWFLGANDLGLYVADPARGACCDGLEETGVNRNEGGSTLMWLTAAEHIRAIRDAEPARAARPSCSPRRPDDPTDPLFRRDPRTRSCPPPTSRIRRTRSSTRRRPASTTRPSSSFASKTSRDLPAPCRPQPRRRLELAVRSRAAAPGRRRSRSGGNVGLRDPRVTWLPEREEWAIASTAYSRRGPLVGLATTRFGPSAGSGRSCRQRTRMRPCSTRWRALGDDPPPLPAPRRRPHVAVVLTRTSATGATTGSSSKRATAPGGTPGRSAWVCRSRRHMAGW